MIPQELQEKIDHALDYLIKLNQRSKTLEQAREKGTAFQKGKSAPLDEVFRHFERVMEREINGPPAEERQWFVDHINHARALGHIDIRMPRTPKGYADYKTLRKTLNNRIETTLEACRYLDMIDTDPNVNAAFHDDPRLEGFRVWYSLSGPKQGFTYFNGYLYADKHLHDIVAHAVDIMDGRVHQERMEQRRQTEKLAAEANEQAANEEYTKSLFALELPPKAPEGLKRLAFWRKPPVWKPLDPLKEVKTVEDALAYLDDLQGKDKGIRKSGVTPDIDKAIIYLSNLENPEELDSSRASLDKKERLKTLAILREYHVSDVGFSLTKIKRNAYALDYDRLCRRTAAQRLNLLKAADLLEELKKDPNKLKAYLNDSRLDTIAETFDGLDIGEAAQRIVKLRPPAAGPSAGPATKTASGPTSGPTSGAGPTAAASSPFGPAASSASASTPIDPNSPFKDIFEELDRKAKERALRREKGFLFASKEMLSGTWGKIKGFVRPKSGPQSSPKGPGSTAPS